MKILILLILMMSACYHDPSIAKCDEEIGVKAANEQNSGLAYQSLKNCENDPNASGEALHYLHSLVSFDGQGQYQSFQARMDHSFNLECKAARKGYIVAIRWFGSVYQQGPYRLNGEVSLMAEFDLLLKEFVSQKRMKINVENYQPCWVLGRE